MNQFQKKLRHVSPPREKVYIDMDYWEIKKTIHEIIPNLFLTSTEGSKNKEKMLELGITHVFIPATLSSDVLFRYPEHFVYKNIDILDTENENISQYFDKIFNWMHEILTSSTSDGKQHKLLLHCHEGISRSASFIIGYIMTIYKQNFMTTLNQVINIRSCVCPNKGFAKQLEQLECTTI
jgi:protein-tyrosine phosphatase